MSRSGEITHPFGENECVFRLGIEQWRKIQERCDCGPPELLMRFAPIVRAMQAGLNYGQMIAQGMLGTWRVDDLREVLLQGLIGGDMGATAAGILVRQQFDERMSWEHAPLVFSIVQTSLMPPEDESLGEKKGATTKQKPVRRRSRGGKSGSQESSAAAR